MEWQYMDPHNSETDPGDLFGATEAWMVTLGEGDYLLAAVDRESGRPYYRVVLGGREIAEADAASLAAARMAAEAIYTQRA
jgi:hypothetical protein